MDKNPHQSREDHIREVKTIISGVQKAVNISKIGDIENRGNKNQKEGVVFGVLRSRGEKIDNKSPENSNPSNPLK